MRGFVAEVSRICCGSVADLSAIIFLLLLLLTDEHITIRNKQGAIDLRTTGFLK